MLFIIRLFRWLFFCVVAAAWDESDWTFALLVV